jgi:RsiW-degrading membrane proteinase PrsW (M82 family)
VAYGPVVVTVAGVTQYPPSRLAAGTAVDMSSWTSIVIGAGVPVLLVGIAMMDPLGPLLLALSLVAGFVVVPTALFAARHDPLPVRVVAYAILWGATVAVSFAALLNAIGSVAAGAVLTPQGRQFVTLVFIAPVVEEALKFIGLRRVSRGLRSRLHILVLAACVATGFTVVEDLLYFIGAAGDGTLGTTFLVRALATPFSHTLFTFATAFGLSQTRVGGRRLPAIVGLVAAIFIHGMFNSLAAAGELLPGAFVALVIIGMVAIFVSGISVLFMTASSHRQTMMENARRLGLPPDLQELLISSAARRTLKGRFSKTDRRQVEIRLAATRDMVRPGGAAPPLLETSPDFRSRQLTSAKLTGVIPAAPGMHLPTSPYPAQTPPVAQTQQHSPHYPPHYPLQHLPPPGSVPPPISTPPISAPPMSTPPTWAPPSLSEDR